MILVTSFDDVKLERVLDFIEREQKQGFVLLLNAGTVFVEAKNVTYEEN